jgi:ornithine cyclodeaminase/alanine dehydrogenase-like protein (mu-crystallin family)
MRLVGAEELLGALSYVDAVDALEAAFRSEDPAGLPARVNMPVPGGELLQMPAFGAAGVGVKLVTLNPGNPDRDLPFVQGVYVLFCRETLRPLAVIDGGALTALRTAAVSALATRHLARADARRLVVFGAGAQADAHIEAIAAVRPIEHVAIVGRSGTRAAALAQRARERGLAAEVAGPEAVGRADVVCTCTTSVEPLFGAGALAAGAHVNAVGSYRVDRRELAPELLRRALVVVETVEAALEEAGDLVQAIAEGAFTRAEIAGELTGVVRGTVRRTSAAQVTLFKSVGLALEDLALAGAAAQRLGLGAPVAAG